MGSNKRRADETEEERKARKRAKKQRKKAKRGGSSGGDDVAPIAPPQQDERPAADSATADNQPIPGPDEAAGRAVEPNMTVERTSWPTQQRNLFSKCHIRLSLALFPSALVDINTRIRAQIRKYMILKYFDPLQGVLLGYEALNVSRDQKLRGAHPHIHFSVTLQNAVVFGPIREGNDLVGIISEASYPSHLGVLIHDWFNASIASSELEAAGYEYDANLERWASSDASIVNEQDHISFSILKVHAVEGVVSVEGTKPKIVATGGSTI